MKRKNRVNQKYGRLTVIAFHKSEFNGGRKRAFWECQCECGNVCYAESGRLEAGYTKSCGCLKIERTKNINLSHGEGGRTKEYRAWSKIKERCHTPTSAKYYVYGARGIKVCDRWRYSYENFLADMGRAPSEKHSIDRIDVNGNYEPGNCRWATTSQQANNMRQTVHVEYKGEVMSMRQWCNKLGMPYKSVHALRKYKGLSFDEILKYYGKI